MPSAFYYCENAFQIDLNDMGENSFESIWNWPQEWVEPINLRRGGWSGVTKHSLQCKDGSTKTVFLKRQENQTRRAMASAYLSRPSYWFEYVTLNQVNRTKPFGPKLLCYGQRNIKGDLQALLISANLEGFVTLEQILSTPTLTPRHEEYLKSVGQLIRLFHQQRWVHGALYTKHIFLNPKDARCLLIDFEKSYRSLLPKNSQKKDMDRLFRRTTKFTQEYRDILMTEVDQVDNYKSRIKNEMGIAEAYTQRKQHKHDAEINLIRRALECVDGVKSILDAPCGTGRATIMLTREGYTTTGVDLGEAAILVAKQKLNEAGVSARIEQADIENFPYENNSFDAILCFRLYHHFPNNKIRENVVGELCRVASSYVIISYLSPFSYTSIKRKLRKIFFHKPSRQHTNSLASLQIMFSKNGYHLVKNFPRQRFFHTLHLAVFKAN